MYVDFIRSVCWRGDLLSMEEVVVVVVVVVVVKVSNGRLRSPGLVCALV